MEYSANSGARISKRQLKRLKAYEIARSAFLRRDEQVKLSKQARFKSGSWITVPPRPRVSDPHRMNFNRGGYTTYSLNTGLWLSR